MAHQPRSVYEMGDKPKQHSNAGDPDPRALAQRIATALFTNGQRERAQRLVLEGPDGRDLGGWCQQAAEDVITRCLETKGPA